MCAGNEHLVLGGAVLDQSQSMSRTRLHEQQQVGRHARTHELVKDPAEHAKVSRRPIHREGRYEELALTAKVVHDLNTLEVHRVFSQEAFEECICRLGLQQEAPGEPRLLLDDAASVLVVLIHGHLAALHHDLDRHLCMARAFTGHTIWPRETSDSLASLVPCPIAHMHAVLHRHLHHIVGLHNKITNPKHAVSASLRLHLGCTGCDRHSSELSHPQLDLAPKGWQIRHPHQNARPVVVHDVARDRQAQASGHDWELRSHGLDEGIAAFLGSRCYNKLPLEHLLLLDGPHLLHKLPAPGGMSLLRLLCQGEHQLQLLGQFLDDCSRHDRLVAAIITVHQVDSNMAEGNDIDKVFHSFSKREKG